LDKWVIVKLNQLIASVTAYMDVFDTVRAAKDIVDFVNDFSTWYVRRSRDRIKSGGDDAKQALAVLGAVLAEISKLLAPFMPFLAEFIYRDLTRLRQTSSSVENNNLPVGVSTKQQSEASAGAAGLESVHLASWPKAGEVDQSVIDKMLIVREIVSIGLSVRKQKSVAVRQPLLALAFELNDAKMELDAQYLQLVLDELNVKQVEQNLLDKDLRPAQAILVPGTKSVKTFYLDLNITPELKREGLARELERAVQDLRKKSGLKVGELVDVYYNTQDENLEGVLLNLFDRKKTFVSQINKSLEVEVDFETQNEIDGKAVWLGMVKI
jgi:isoleucyl-tRNA synthetase